MLGSTTGISRRAVLQGAAAIAVAVPAAAFAGPADAASGDEFDTLRLRWRELLLGSGFDATAEPYASRLSTLGTSAAGFRRTMAPATGLLWPDLAFSTSSGNVTESYRRLNTMAQAWAQPGTGCTGDSALLTAVVTGLDHLYSQVYKETTVRYGNWWDWQIGSSRLSLDTALLVYDALATAQIAQYTAAIDHFVPDSAVASYTGTSTGANRTDLCRVLATRGVLGKTPDKIALARDALSPVLPYVTSGDGLYADGSFIQHTYIAYTGSYGEVQIDGLARLFALLSGSTWEVTDPNRQLAFDSVERAYAPFLHDGLVMDAVSGRAISRGLMASDATRVQIDDHVRGHAILAHVVMLADAASPVERARWHGMVKGWVQRDTYAPVLADSRIGIADLARLQTVATSAVTAAPEPEGHRLFPAMDRAVHRRPGWTASLSMASRRISYYENGNGENLRGWHTGSGMLTWWAGPDTSGQYSDGFWPTVDPYRLPGTTVSAKPLADGEGGPWGAARPDVTWVGGTTDGEFAAVGQELKGLSSTLTARKSWFWLDDTVVCLGAGISAHDGVGVTTTVDNRNLGAAGSNALTVDGVIQPATTDWRETFTDVHWAHLAGHGGYVFPGGAALTASRTERTGNWKAINTGGSADPVTRRYVTLSADHGIDPANATYAYLLMPGAQPSAVAERSADPEWLHLLGNTADAQGISVPSLGVTAVNFWAPGTLDTLTTTAPASILLRRTGRRATLCVAAPDRSGTPFEITWSHPAMTVDWADQGVEVLSTGQQVLLRVTPGTACATFRVAMTSGSSRAR